MEELLSNLFSAPCIFAGAQRAHYVLPLGWVHERWFV